MSKHAPPGAPALVVAEARDFPILVAEGLRKVFRVQDPGSRYRHDFVAVDGVTFSITRGGSVGIVGESGSGKTTVARMLSGLERPTAGRIVVDGRDRSTPARRARERKRRGGELQIVFQDPYTSLDPRQRVADALDEVLRLHLGLDGEARRRRTAELLDQVGLDESHGRALPRNLSGGQRQRVAIARALAAQPSVLVLDEAVSALDVSIQAQLLNLLNDIRRQTGMSYLFISHNLAVVQQLTEEMLVLQRGRVVEFGPTRQILSAPAHEYTQLLLASVPGPEWRPQRVLAAQRTQGDKPALVATSDPGR